jgi:hypothetical protein
METPALETVTVSPYRAEIGLSSGAYPSPQPAPFGLYPLLIEIESAIPVGQMRRSLPSPRGAMR